MEEETARGERVPNQIKLYQYEVYLPVVIVYTAVQCGLHIVRTTESDKSNKIGRGRRENLHAVTHNHGIGLTIAEAATTSLYVRGLALCRHLEAEPKARGVDRDSCVTVLLLVSDSSHPYGYHLVIL